MPDLPRPRRPDAAKPRRLSIVGTEEIGLQRMYVVAATYDRHWTDPIYELFSSAEVGSPTHCHVYRLESFMRGKGHQRLPASVTSISFPYSHLGEAPRCSPWHGQIDPPWL
jgi:hypothetical protein